MSPRFRLDTCSTMFISKLYKSQAHYAHGATMCTSLYLLGGCLGIIPLCSVEDMDVLMKHAADVHSKLVLRGQEGMLQQHEIFQATRVPENIDVKELGVYSGVPDSSFPPTSACTWTRFQRSVCPTPPLYSRGSVTPPRLCTSRRTCFASPLRGGVHGSGTRALY